MLNEICAKNVDLVIDNGDFKSNFGVCGSFV